MDTNKEKIKEGDVVSLNSGGQSMTVETIEGDEAICCWNEHGQSQKERYRLVALMKGEGKGVILP
jgi:uncharacterized protein YodC (DUF2158 family)